MSVRKYVLPRAYYIRVQIGLLIVLMCIHLLVEFGVLPSPEAVVIEIEEFFEKYGVPAVALTSFLENLFGFNVYFPGSIVILTAMALTAGRPTLAIITFTAIVIPSMMAHIVNYWIGLKTRLKNRGEESRRYSKPGFLEFFLAFWHPHTAAIVCIRAGTTGVSGRDFAARFLPASLTWNSFWGIAMYSVGGLSRATGGFILLIYIYILGWAAWDLFKFSSHEMRSTAD